MLAPGVPTAVAHDIAAHENDPAKMAKAVVATTMNQTYGPAGEGFAPAAAFDVIDLDPAKMQHVRDSVATLDASLVSASEHRAERAAIREDARAIDGMVRFPEGKAMPWRADRPAVALYDTFSQDGRLDPAVRSAAANARDAIANTVLAHRESADFAPSTMPTIRTRTGPRSTSRSTRSKSMRGHQRSRKPITPFTKVSAPTI